jgi:spore coat protein U-like protein
MKKNIILVLCLALNAMHAEAAVSCSISSPGVFFGVINPLSPVEVTSIGAINLNCTGGPVTYTITLSQGNGSMVQRVMKSGLNSLNYNLYTSNSYSTVLGDGTAGSLAISGSSITDPTLATYAVYGKISNIGLSSTVAGAYNDSVSITIVY